MALRSLVSSRGPIVPSMRFPARMYRLQAAWALPVFFAAPSLATLPLCAVLLSAAVCARGLVRGRVPSFYGVFSGLVAFACATLVVPVGQLDPLVFACAGLHVLAVAVICAAELSRVMSA